MLNNIVGFLGEGVAASTNSYESIATVTVGAGGSSSISFTSIPSTYKHLQVRLIGRSDRGGGNNGDYIKLTMNSDTGANYADHQLTGDGSTAATSVATSANFIRMNRIAATSSTTNVFGTIVMDILDYQNTNKYKTTRQLGGNDTNGSGDVWFISGLWQSTSAISSLTLTVGGGTNFLQYSSFALYGVKG